MLSMSKLYHPWFQVVWAQNHIVTVHGCRFTVHSFFNELCNYWSILDFSQTSKSSKEDPIILLYLLLFSTMNGYIIFYRIIRNYLFKTLCRAFFRFSGVILIFILLCSSNFLHLFAVLSTAKGKNNCLCVFCVSAVNYYQK